MAMKDRHITAAIFDLDGTVLDTLCDLAQSVNFALKANGLPERSTDEVRAFVGNGIKNLIMRSVPEGTGEALINRVFADFKEHYALHCKDYTRPYTGIIQVAEKLKAMGIKTAVVSNKADFAAKMLADYYFPKLFDCVIGEKEGVARKPAPDTVNTAMQELGVSRENAVYIGDSEVDIQTAENAKMPCISVTWGFRSREYLLKNGAKILADSPYGLLEMITE